MPTIAFPDGLTAEPLALVLLGSDGLPTAEARLARVLQRVALRLSTPRGSVPLDRAFGLDPDVLDEPLSRVARLRQAVADALRSDPDVRLRAVYVDPSVASGRLGRVPVRVELDVLAA